MRPTAHLTHTQGQWRVHIERAAQVGRDAHLLDLGGCTSRKVAVRLWLSLQVQEGQP